MPLAAWQVCITVEMQAPQPSCSQAWLQLQIQPHSLPRVQMWFARPSVCQHVRAGTLHQPLVLKHGRQQLSAAVTADTGALKRTGISSYIKPPACLVKGRVIAQRLHQNPSASELQPIPHASSTCELVDSNAKIVCLRPVAIAGWQGARKMVETSPKNEHWELG